MLRIISSLVSRREIRLLNIKSMKKLGDPTPLPLTRPCKGQNSKSEKLTVPQLFSF